MWLNKETFKVAEYIVSFYEKHNDTNFDTQLTSKRLQKLIYFSDLKYRKEYGLNLVDDDYYVWNYGPAIPDIYYTYDFLNGSYPNMTYNHYCKKTSKAYDELDYDKKNIIDKVIKTTLSKSTNELVEMAQKHTEGLDMGSIFNFKNINQENLTF